jgi:acyl-CoA thioesterase-1
VNPDSGGSSKNPERPPQATLEVYVEQLERIVDRMQETGAVLIFATTTPVPEGGVRPHRDPSDVPAYNAAAVELMKKRGVAVNDLHACALPRLEELQRPVNVHFTRTGSDALAEKVAEAIMLSAPSR